MADKEKKYTILSHNGKSKLQNIASIVEPKALPRNLKFFQRPAFLPVVLGVGVWTGCMWYAYSAYKNKDCTQDTIITEDDHDKEITVVELPHKWHEPKVMQDRGFKNFSGNLPPRNDDGSPVVSINHDLKRVEITELTSYGWIVKTVSFDNIQKNENGELKFHPNGYPIYRETWHGKILMKLWNSVFR